MPTFTIFTGTYNSAPVIDRVFSSIRNQQVKDFEWIVIDDCSKDNTRELVRQFQTDYPAVDLRFFEHEQNTGIATSRKEALNLATGKYFVTWDHDDEQAADQLSIYLQLWQEHDAKDIGNIFAKMRNQHGELLGQPFPKDPYISDYISLHNRYLIGNSGKGRVVEHHVCVKTEVFLEVLSYYEKHPELVGGRYPNGGDVWGMLAYLGYRTICTNKEVRRYFVAEPGRESMTSQANRKSGAARILANKLLWVNYFDSRLPLSELLMKLRNIFAVAMYGYLANMSLTEVLSKVQPFFSKIALLLVWLPAVGLGKRYQ